MDDEWLKDFLELDQAGEPEEPSSRFGEMENFFESLSSPEISIVI